MSALFAFAAVTFPSIFFVVDPIAAVPLFLAMTAGYPTAKKQATAAKAAMATAIALVVFAAAGGVIFRMFGITLGAFKVAGGILLFRMALDMKRSSKGLCATKLPSSRSPSRCLQDQAPSRP